MAERPTRLSRWAYDPPAGALVEPPSSFAKAGFATGTRPPAEWINYQLHFSSAWADYLAGPGWGALTRTAHGGSAPVFTAVTGLAVDTDDSRAELARYRYVAVGAITGPAAAIAVSRTGREWVTRAIPNGCTAIRGVVMLGNRCMIWGSHSAPDERAWQTSLAVGDSSAIFVSDATYWDVCTDSVGNLADVVAVAYDGAITAFALTVSGGGATDLYRSRNGGQTWPVSVGTLAFVASSVGTGLAWDATRSRLVIVGSKGDTYTLVPAEDVGVSVYAQRQTLPTAPTTGTIHLRTGGGTCLAWASLDASGTPLAASRIWRSDDGGETWAAVTLATAFGATLTDVTYADGVWVATTSASPYLWRSDDAGSTWERVPLPLDESASWAIYRAAYADGALTATGLTWTVATTRATGLAPDSSRVYSPEPGYLADAGYLRGQRIASTAPTDNQVLVWDAVTSRWTPETPAAGMANPMTTAGDLIRGGTAGAPTRVAVGTTGQVLTVAAGVPGWADPAGGGPAIGTGTYAARPASPTEGDTYTVTSGVRRGSVYRCDVAGIWTLLTVALPQLAACVALLDGERGVERAGSLLRRWVNLAPRGRGYDITATGTPQPVAAVGSTGLLAYDTTAGRTTMRGVLPPVAASGARSVAALVYPVGPFGGTDGNPNFLPVVGWGAGVTNGAFELVARANHIDFWGLHYWGSANASATSCVEAAPVVVVATYDGTTARIYREGSEIHTHVIALTGNATDGYLGVMSGVEGALGPKGPLHFAGAWDVALSAGEVTTLTSLLRERYGL